MKNNIIFSHFEKEDGTKTDTIVIYAGNLGVPDFIEDVELKLTILPSGEMDIKVLPNQCDDYELKQVKKILKNIDWDGGYEFFDFFNNLDTPIPFKNGSYNGRRWPKYELIGKSNSKMFDIVTSPQNVQNLKKVENQIKKLK